MKRDYILLTLDIGSSRIVGSLVKKTPDGKPDILHVVYKEVAFQSEPDATRFAALIAKSLESCLTEIKLSAKGHSPDKICCTLSSLVYEPHISVQSKDFPSDTTVTAEHMKSLVSPAPSDGKPGTVLVNRTVMRVKVNGYPTASPVGKSARRVETAVYSSMADATFLESVKKTIGAHFDTARLEIYPFSFCAFSVVRDIVQDQDFVCLDFGGEITDLIIVKDDIIVKTISILFGKNTILRGLMKKMGVSLEVAESSIAMYNQGTLAPESSEAIKQSLFESKEKWDGLFLSTLESITLDLLLPHDIYLLSHDSMAKIVGSFIKNERYNKYVFVGQPFVAHQITDKTLSPFCTSSNLSTLRDPFVMISSLFSDKIKQQP